MSAFERSDKFYVKRKRVHEQQGATGLVSQRRGQPSNKQLSHALKETAVELIRSRYPDFGPTFAHEKLTEHHELKLSVESTRRIMIKNGIWKGKKRKVGGLAAALRNTHHP